MLSPISKINSPNPAISMYLQSNCLHVVCTISSTCKICQIEINSVPTFRETNWHGRAKRANSSNTLKVTHAKSSMKIFIIQYLIKNEI